MDGDDYEAFTVVLHSLCQCNPRPAADVVVVLDDSQMSHQAGLVAPRGKYDYQSAVRCGVTFIDPCFVPQASG
jgi:hypothetical protein